MCVCISALYSLNLPSYMYVSVLYVVSIYHCVCMYHTLYRLNLPACMYGWISALYSLDVTSCMYIWMLKHVSELYIVSIFRQVCVYVCVCNIHRYRHDFFFVHHINALQICKYNIHNIAQYAKKNMVSERGRGADQIKKRKMTDGCLPIL